MDHKTFEKLVHKTYDMISEDENFCISFYDSKYEDLIQFHPSLGRYIRNNLGLWDNPWTPQIEDYTDVSPDHPDAISMRLIKEVWKLMHG